jgi:hypothetical protein
MVASKEGVEALVRKVYLEEGAEIEVEEEAEIVVEEEAGIEEAEEAGIEVEEGAGIEGEEGAATTDDRSSRSLQTLRTLPQNRRRSRSWDRRDALGSMLPILASDSLVGLGLAR